MATGEKLDLGGEDLYVNNLFVGATGPGSSGTSITSTENATNVNVGASGTAGTLKVFPATAAKGDLKITATNNTGNTETSITNAAYGQATVLTLPDPGGATANFVLSTGTSTATTATSTELNTVSGVTPGTVIASKALVADSGIKINGLLNSTFGAGTTSVAPINLTAGTNLTTAVAGAVEFDGTAFYATSVASARQQVDAEQYIIATANSATYSNTGLDTASAAAVFTSTTNSGVTNGAVTLVAGKTYCFEFLYNLTNTGTTSHTWATLFGGTASFSAGTNYQVYGTSGTTASTPSTGGLAGFRASTTMSTAVVATAASTSATEQVTVQGFGVFVINAGGTVIPQMQASARPGATGTPGVILLAGSFFRVWEMGTNNFVGNWS